MLKNGLDPSAGGKEAMDAVAGISRAGIEGNDRPSL